MCMGTLTRPVRLRRTTSRTPGRLITATIAYVLLAACHDLQAPHDPDPVSTASSYAAEASATPSRSSQVYRANDRPCDLVDHRLLAGLFGPDSDNVTPPQYTTNTIVTTMVCNRSYSRRGDDSTIVSLRVALADPAAIEAQYQGLRNLHAKSATLTDISGLGQGYTYIDKTLGPQLALYDGNAYLTIGAAPLSRSAKPSTRTLPVLIEIAYKALTLLKG